MALTLPGSPYVESSDLVANYPAVSESLAERVDLVGVLPFADSAARTTALPTPTDGQYSYLQDTNSTEVYNGTAWVAAGTAPGLVLVNTTAFSAAAAVNINSVFSSTYQNYQIVTSFVTSVDEVVRLRLRASGTDITGATYNVAAVGFGTDNTTQNFRQLSNTNILFYVTSVESNSQTNSLTMDIFSPFESAWTAYTFQSIFAASNGSYYSFAGGGQYYQTTVADGFSLIPDSGNITGTVRVYGYKNS